MADVKYIITADADGAIKEFKQVDGAVDNMRGTTERGTRSLKGMWKQMAVGVVAIAGVVAALRGAKGLAGSFMDVAIQTEQYEIQLKTLLGSQEKATQAFEFFQGVAASLPYTLEEVIQSGTRLAAINVPFEGWIPRIADLASAIGMDLAQATDQMARAMKGGLGAADLFREKGVSAMIQEFAKLEKGIDDVSKLSMPELQKVLWDFTEQFKGASEEMATTWKGITSMLADKWFQFRAAMMESGVFEFLKKGLAEFNKKLDEFVESGKMEEWASDTARAVLKSFKAILQGIQGMLAGMQILKASWYDLNESINRTALRFYQKVLPVFYLFSKISSEVKEETIGLVKEMANLMVETMEYAKAGEEATGKAADLLNVFDDMIRFLDEAIRATDKTKKSTENLSGALNSLGAPAGPAAKVKKALGEIVIGYDNWGKVVVKISEIVKNLHDSLESRYFTPVKKKLFDLKEFWKDVNEQIEASWIRGISKMITEFKNFSGAISQLLKTMFQMFADTIAKIVVEWVTGAITIKAALASVGAAIKAFSLAFAIYVGVNLLKNVLTTIGILEGKVDEEINAIMDKLEEAKRKGEEVLETIRKSQLAFTPPTGEIPFGGYRGGEPEAPDYSSLLGKLPAALKAMIAATNIPKKLEAIGRIAARSFKLLIAQGYSFFDALTALKEPLGMLRDKFLELGQKVPPALRPILAMFEKMDKRPKLFEAMSGVLDILKAFTETGWMTQSMLKDLVQSTASFVRNILGVTGNLKKALAEMGSLTKEQIMMLAPLIAPFLEAAQKFGLRLPDWIKNLASKMGLKIEKPAINEVPPLLDRIRRRMGKETTRIVKAIRGVEKAIGGIPSGQHGLDFQSGPSGGLVRYHPNERVTVSPNISVQPASVNMRSTPVYIYLDKRKIAEAVFDLLPEYSKDHGVKFNKRGLVG